MPQVVMETSRFGLYLTLVHVKFFAPTNLASGRSSAESPTFASTSSTVSEPTEGLLLCQFSLVVGGESDVMPRLCSPRRDGGRITLSCVAGDRGAPGVHRLVALCGRKDDGVLASLRVFGAVLFSLFPGSSFLVSHFPILGFGLLFPAPTGAEG